MTANMSQFQFSHKDITLTMIFLALSFAVWLFMGVATPVEAIGDLATTSYARALPVRSDIGDSVEPLEERLKRVNAQLESSEAQPSPVATEVAELGVAGGLSLYTGVDGLRWVGSVQTGWMNCSWLAPTGHYVGPDKFSRWADAHADLWSAMTDLCANGSAQALAVPTAPEFQTDSAGVRWVRVAESGAGSGWYPCDQAVALGVTIGVPAAVADAVVSGCASS